MAGSVERALVATATACALAGVTPEAHAGGAPAPSARVPYDVIVEETSPNGDAILVGSFMFALTYGSSAVISRTSTNEADKNLLVPLAGPWMDLGTREGCHDPRGRGCDGETVNGALLVADGILQLVGAMEIARGFIFPKRRIVERRTVVSVTPAAGSAGVGLFASGRF